MSRSYLWDGTGEPDPDVQELEDLFSTFRADEEPAELGELPPRSDLPGGRRRWLPMLLLAAAVLLVSGVWWASSSTPPTVPGNTENTVPGTTLAEVDVREAPAPQAVAWSVSTTQGEARCGQQACRDGLRPGDWLETLGESRAELTIADIGTMQVAPQTRLRLLGTSSNQHRLELAAGEIHASVLAPPRLLIVETPSATAVDLGCEYTLRVAEDGSSSLEVFSGWVALESKVGDVYVPAGARANSDPERGLGTPYMTYAEESFIKALATYDLQSDDASLQTLLKDASLEDTLSLWHLLRTANTLEHRKQLLAGILEKTTEPLPDGVTDALLLARESSALMRFKTALEDHWVD